MGAEAGPLSVGFCLGWGNAISGHFPNLPVLIILQQYSDAALHQLDMGLLLESRAGGRRNGLSLGKLVGLSIAFRVQPFSWTRSIPAGAAGDFPEVRLVEKKMNLSEGEMKISLFR